MIKLGLHKRTALRARPHLQGPSCLLSKDEHPTHLGVPCPASIIHTCNVAMYNSNMTLM